MVGGLTDRGFAELVVGDFVGDVGTHEYTDVDLQALPDDVRDEPETLRTLVDTLRRDAQTHSTLSQRVLLHSFVVVKKTFYIYSIYSK